MRLIDADKLIENECAYCSDKFSYLPCEPSDCSFYAAVTKAPTVDADAEIKALKKANADMYLDCTEAEGKAARLELEVGNLKEKLWDLEHPEEEI